MVCMICEWSFSSARIFLLISGSTAIWAASGRTASSARMMDSFFKMGTSGAYVIRSFGSTRYFDSIFGIWYLVFLAQCGNQRLPRTKYRVPTTKYRTPAANSQKLSPSKRILQRRALRREQLRSALGDVHIVFQTHTKLAANIKAGLVA